MAITKDQRLDAGNAFVLARVSRTLDQLSEKRRKERRSSLLPRKVVIRLEAIYSEGSVTETVLSLTLPDKLLESSFGRLSANINRHDVSVHHDGSWHFKATIDGRDRGRLSAAFAENALGVKVRKSVGSVTAEPVSRAIWRHLVAVYNRFDDIIKFSYL